MNKTELINAVAERAGLSKIDARNAIEAAIDVAADTLAAGERITILGYGTYSVNEKPERTGVNPRTKEHIIIPARKTIRFKPGIEFLERLG